jgi:hypothetical protein
LTLGHTIQRILKEEISPFIPSIHGQIGVYLNRIAALGGETIELKQGNVFINGVLTKENYVRSENRKKKGIHEYAANGCPTKLLFCYGRQP